MPADVVEFQSDDTHGALLRLGYDPVDADIGTLSVEIRAKGLACDEGVLSIRGDGLDEFLASLDADSRGWDHTRRWHSLEGAMTIEATHHGNRVELLFIVRRNSEQEAWEVRLPVRVAPGESLARVAKSTAELFTLPEPL